MNTNILKYKTKCIFRTHAIDPVVFDFEKANSQRVNNLNVLLEERLLYYYSSESTEINDIVLYSYKENDRYFVMIKAKIKAEYRTYTELDGFDLTEVQFFAFLKAFVFSSKLQTEEQLEIFLREGFEIETKSNFVNFSNHPSERWGNEQRSAALELGEKIIDVDFPQVSPDASIKNVFSLAEKCVIEIMKQDPSCVMVQGEFTLGHRVVELLNERHIKVVSATTQRDAVERFENGEIVKTSVFHFVGFRPYYPSR